MGCWLIPSIWPETFSYAVHEALATGLPVFVFDLGAQAHAAAAAENGHLLAPGCEGADLEHHLRRHGFAARQHRAEPDEGAAHTGTGRAQTTAAVAKNRA